MVIDLFICMAFLSFSFSYENLAYLKPTWQATTHFDMESLGSDKAVDGLKSNLSWFGNQCAISSNYETSATWWVDLKSIRSIHHIVIYYRTNNFPWDVDNEFKRRFLGFSIYVSNTHNKENGTLCFHDNEYNLSTIPAVVNISCTVHGRYVIYYNERNPSKDYPQDYSETAYSELCEVEVYGCPFEGYYGSNCEFPCMENCQQCDIETGECLQCMAGYEGVNCKMRNLAYKHPAWQITNYSPIFGAEKAVDGLKSDFTPHGQQCSISAPNQMEASWRVNLLANKFVHHIRIYYRTDGIPWGENNLYAGRFLGFSVFISETERIDNGSLCFHDTEFNMTTIPAVVNITCQLYGQYVIYYNERKTDEEYPPDYSKYAYSELCEVEVYGCALGYYGSNCSLRCPIHCQNCDTEMGACLWCDIGFRGENCDFPCLSGTFGANCTRQCGQCARYCDHRYGNCSGVCTPGFKGIMCNEECPSGSYGADCQEYCGQCKGECNHVHGTCHAGCQPGYKGLTCKAECASGTYGIDCSSGCGECLGVCDHINGHCPRGCKAGYEGIKCNKECSVSRYGANCSEHCGECVEGCSHVDGICVGGCKAGYKGRTCDDACEFGYFGNNCQQECSMFCFTSRNCSRFSGQCEFGCKLGWKGLDCLEMREQRGYRIFIPAEIIAVLTISLVFNACLLFAFIIRRYHYAHKRKQRFCSCRPRHLSAGVQTGLQGPIEQEHSESDNYELQYLDVNIENNYCNM